MPGHKRRVDTSAVPLSFITQKIQFAPGRTFAVPTPFGLAADDPNSLKDWPCYYFRSQRYSLAHILSLTHLFCQERPIKNQRISLP